VPSVSEVSSLHEAAEVLAGAAAEGRRVSIGREGGDVVLSTERLDAVLEHEAGDLTAIVEAGVRVRDLNDRLADRGQMLALDPPGNPTIGACVAANLSGPRRHRYGTARDLVLGVTVVLADGTIASSGGKVVKNVAGYDLAKLFCGSEGKLGLVARVALRLHPRPDAVGTLAVPLESAEDAEAKARAILRSPFRPSAVDVLWPGSLAVMFEGGRRAVDEQLAAAQALVGGAEDAGSVWAEAEARQGRAQGRLLFPPGSLARTLGGLEETVVRVSAGVAYVPEPVSDPRDPGAIELAERVRAQLDPHGVLA
jgi:glycolate dehydrogenase FAD-binding subunit